MADRLEVGLAVQRVAFLVRDDELLKAIEPDLKLIESTLCELFDAVEHMEDDRK